jgi:dTDP-4-dehydrorhamnose 3,5-epimerase
MDLTLEATPLPDAFVVRHQVFEDERGRFMELFRQDLFEALGLPGRFVQANLSRSLHGVVRGLHFQWEPPMGKLMRVTSGRALLVAVDIRRGSPALGRWFGLELAAGDPRQLWAPAGFARGFAATGDHAEVEYLCTGIYNPDGESGIRWDDPAIGIDWPLADPLLSAKDRRAQSLAEWLGRQESGRFTYPEPAAAAPPREAPR